MSLPLSPLRPVRRNLLQLTGDRSAVVDEQSTASPSHSHVSAGCALSAGVAASRAEPSAASAVRADEPAVAAGVANGPLTIWEADDDGVADKSAPSPAPNSPHAVVIDMQRASSTVAVVQARHAPQHSRLSSGSRQVAHFASSESASSTAGLQSSTPQPAAVVTSLPALKRLVASTSAASSGAPSTYSSPKQSASTKSASLSRPPPVSLLTSTLTLPQLLADSRLFPLNQSEFRRFLVRSYVDELLEFLVTLAAYKTDLTALQLKAGKLNTAPAVCMEEKRRLIALKDMLLHRFIRVGSERELNLSERMRQQLLDTDDEYRERYSSCDNTGSYDYYDFTHHKDVPILLALFDEAEREVVRLIEQGSYVELFYKQQTRNIDAREIAFRKYQGVALMALSVALTVVLLLTVHARWYRLLVIPTLFIASTSLLTAQCGVCPMLQLQGATNTYTAIP